jgi:hypothetical protein
MTIRVEQHAVFYPITAAMYSPNKVVAVPATLLSDFLTADRTDAPL